MQHRLEFREGTSDKFWEVSVDGTEVTTRWGRAGTAGQSKTKGYASESEALADANKQLEEKKRKGYLLAQTVAAGGAALPARKTRADSVELSPEDDPPVELSIEGEPTVEVPSERDWQTAVREKWAPWRRDGRKQSKVDPAARLKELRQKLKKDLPLVRAGLGLTTPTLLPAARASCELLEGRGDQVSDPSVLLALTEKQASVYLAHSLPPVQTLEALLGMGGLTLATRHAATGTLVARWVVRETQLSHQMYDLPVMPWLALRAILATCAEPEYRAALKKAEQVYAQGDHLVRCQLALSFPDAGWAEAEARYGLANQVTLYGTTTILPAGALLTLGSLLDFDLVEQLLGHPYSNPDPAFAPMLLGNFGRRALPWLIKRSGWRDCLYEVSDPAIATALKTLLDDRSERARLSEYFTRHPQLAIPVLAQVVASNSKGKEVARALLGQVLKEKPSLPKLEPREEKLCRELMSRFDTGPVAPDSELPPVLRQLPRRQARKPLVQEVDLPDYPERIHWEGKPPQPYINEVPPAPGALDEKLRPVLLKALKRGQTFISELDCLSDPVALPIWNETPPGSWYLWGENLPSLMARFGVDGLPGVLAYVQANPSEVAELARVESPRVAKLMAAALAGQRAQRVARAWIRRFPAVAALGFAARAVGRPGPEREQAEGACRFMVRDGLASHLHEASQKLGCVHALDEVLDFDPLGEVPARLPRLPAFCDVALLPPPRLNGKSLGAQAMTNLLTMLAFSPLDPPYAGLEQVRKACEPESLERFAWELYSQWLTAGGPAREKWAFLALAHLGGDETARNLAPVLKSWPREGLFARAEMGLDVLGALGTDVALMHIHQMSQKVKSRALQERARLKLEEIALRRGLTTDELADRLVPSLDAEEPLAGMRIVFDEHLRPSLLSPDGKLVKEPPRPAGPAETKRWSALKKDVKALAQSQILRLELAMSRERLWPAATWRVCLLEHPILVYLVRRLIWGAYHQGRLVETFRVAEDSTLANVSDDPFSLPEDAVVGLPHPLELEPAVRDAWARVLGDYAILQPFPQLGRAVFRLTPEEERSESLARFEGLQVAPTRLLSLETRGWRRGPVEDNGGIFSMEKDLGLGLRACLEFEPGLDVGALAQSEKQQIVRVTLEPESPFSVLRPAAASDLLADLEALR